jgi:CBS domain-containing protein
MRAHQIMAKPVITVAPDATIIDAANLMLQKHVSGLPVVDNTGKLVGIVSEGDFIRRSEIGTQRKRGRWLRFILGPGRSASDFVQEHGRKISDVMTKSPLTITEDAALAEIVELMERNNVKRLPVVRDGKVVGIVSRANLLQAVASLAREVPDPTADDDHLRDRIITAMEKNDWCPFGLGVIVKDGIVHLSGVITEERAREAAIVAAENVEGVKKVHDNLCWLDAASGMYLH